MDATNRMSWMGAERRDRRLASRILMALPTLALALVPASAPADGTWDGGGANAGWGTVENWTGDAMTFGADQVFTFYSSGTRLTNYLAAARTIGTLAFNAGADRDMKIRLTSTAGGTAGRILTFDVTAGDAALTIAAGAAGDIEIGVEGATINLNDNLLITHDGSGELWLSAGINGGGRSVTKSGGGMLTLSSVTNTFTGGFTLNAGYVRAGSDRAFGDGTVVINGGILSANSDVRRTLTNAVTFAADVLVGHGTNNGTLAFLGAGVLTGPRVLTAVSPLILYGALDDGGSGHSLVKEGGSALTLAGANTYSGGTAVNNGILNFSSLAAKPAAGAVTVGANGGLGLGVKDSDPLSYWTTSDIDDLWSGTLAGFTLDPSFKLVGIDTSGGDVTYSTSQSTRGLAKFGDNVLTLGAANTFTGGTFVYGGTLRMGHADAVAAGSTVTVFDGAFDPNGETVDMLVRVNNDSALGGGTLVLNGGAISAVGITNSRVLANNYQLAGNFTFGGTNDPAALTMSGTGTLTGTRTVTNESLVTLSGVLGDGGGAHGLVKTGAGTLFLTSADNSYGGVTTVEQGRLSITTNSLGTTGAGTVVKNGAALFVSQVNLSLEEPLTLTGTGIGIGGNTYGALVLNRNTGIWTLNGAITLDGGAALNCYNAGVATVTIPNGITGTGDLTLRSSAANNGNATWFLQGQSTYTGDTILNANNAHSNTVVLQVNNALPATTVVRLQAPSLPTPKPTVTLALNGFNQTVAGIEASAIEVNATNRIVGGSATPSTLTVSNTADFTYGGRLGDSRANENNLALVKTGAGTLSLTFSNTYSGATTVEAGTLRVHGVHTGGGLITVAGGTLGGTGTVGAVTVGASGTLAPGASLGTFTVSSLTLDGGATLAWELDNDGVTSDLLAVTGALTKGAAGAWAFDFLGTGAAGTYTLVTFGSTDFSDGDFTATNLGAGLSGDVDVNAGTLTLTVVPEPGSLGVIGLLAAAAILRRRLR